MEEEPRIATVGDVIKFGKMAVSVNNGYITHAQNDALSAMFKDRENFTVENLEDFYNKSIVYANGERQLLRDAVRSNKTLAEGYTGYNFGKIDNLTFNQKVAASFMGPQHVYGAISLPIQTAQNIKDGYAAAADESYVAQIREQDKRVFTAPDPDDSYGIYGGEDNFGEMRNTIPKNYYEEPPKTKKPREHIPIQGLNPAKAYDPDDFFDLEEPDFGPVYDENFTPKYHPTTKNAPTPLQLPPPSRPAISLSPHTVRSGQASERIDFYDAFIEKKNAITEVFGIIGRTLKQGVKEKITGAFSEAKGAFLGGVSLLKDDVGSRTAHAKNVFQEKWKSAKEYLGLASSPPTYVQRGLFTPEERAATEAARERQRLDGIKVKHKRIRTGLLEKTKDKFKDVTSKIDALTPELEKAQNSFLGKKGSKGYKTREQALGMLNSDKAREEAKAFYAQKVEDAKLLGEKFEVTEDMITDRMYHNVKDKYKLSKNEMSKLKTITEKQGELQKLAKEKARLTRHLKNYNDHGRFTRSTGVIGEAAEKAAESGWKGKAAIFGGVAAAALATVGIGSLMMSGGRQSNSNLYNPYQAMY